MATKTAGGSMYSGLLQTNQELAKAKELESNALSIGLEQGVKPLQGYLMGIANEKKQRETDLKEDQKLAIDQMNMMADTSGLLGDYEPIVTGLAQTTKNMLNNIAKDESLSQYEKAAQYKEAVDKFNKQVSKYSGDQEIVAGITGQYAKGTFSQAINMQGDDYKIGKALSSGNYKIQGDRYIIEGLTDPNVDSNRLKNLYIPENNEAAEKYSSQFGALGLATDDPKKLDAGARQLSMLAGNTQQATEALAVLGVDPAVLYANKEDNIYKTNGEFDLAKMQEEIYKLGLAKSKLTFIEKTPPIIKASTAQLMAKDAKFIIEDAMTSGNFSFLMSKNAKFSGQQIVDATFSGGKLSITTEDKEGFGVPALKTIDLNTALGRKQVGEIILSQAPGSQSVKGEAVSLFNNSFNQIEEEEETKTNTITNTEAYKAGVLKNGQVDLGGYDFTITNLSTDTISDEEDKLGKRREYRAASSTPGSTISTVTYENSPLSSKKKLSEQEFLNLKSDFELTYGDYNDQNLAKFRQDKEGLSDKQIRLRQLDSAVALNIDNEGSVNDSVLEELGVTDTEKRQLRGIKNMTVKDLLKQLYVINADTGTYDSLLASLEPNRDFEN